ncbi:MAG TPA: cupin domain-containing protein, partial [Nitrososphaeraceae archaeon]|nr:cupin domain-containing protein [Nitrososphaeraceae archaeon]
MTKENENEENLKIIQPGKGKHVNMLGDILSIYLSKNETNGTFSILDDKVYPGGGPPPHIQTREFEAFYILEGELDFNIDGKKVTAKTGTVINIPPNVAHNFKNNTNSVVKMLIIIAPAGLEKMFEEFGKEVFGDDYDKTNIKYSEPSSEEKKRLMEICKK